MRHLARITSIITISTLIGTLDMTQATANVERAESTVRAGNAVHRPRPAALSTTHRPCDGWFSRVRPDMNDNGVAADETDRALVNHRAEAMIVCAVGIWPVSGGVFEALRIAHRESGSWIWPWARNPDVASACQIHPVSYGSCGVYQHLVRYWGGRAHAWLRRSWFSAWAWNRGISPFNMWANVIVTIRMAHASGWGPWS